MLKLLRTCHRLAHARCVYSFFVAILFLSLYSVIRGIYCHCISLCYLFVIWDEREVYDSMTIDKFNDGWTSAEHTLSDRK